MQARVKSNTSAFLSARYDVLRNFRSSMQDDPERSLDRRHEVHLRKLIDSGDFDSAGKYTEDMAVYCESVDDALSASLYREYSRRIAEIRLGDEGESESEAVGFV